ncbi:LysM peptidoglycan-binding domain-containing protein [Halomonas salinarum]|uniref:LysM peptidoglycan-binding domain-containing protein n=1 Tax=Halomonas salinarum TaxID=1158993 RepID=UPI00143AE91B|nr:LysM peptidoglycan-binding domain-containing protein [Halomonas salinarum]
MDQRTVATQGSDPRRQRLNLAVLFLTALLLVGCAGHGGWNQSVTPGNWISVKRGDTLGELASQAGVPLERLQRFNPGVKARSLAIGQRLLIPTHQERAPYGGPYRYQVRPGDTYAGIARHFGTRTRRLSAGNPGISASSLRVGQLIQVPMNDANVSRSASSGASSSSRSSASSTQKRSAPSGPLPSSAGSWPWPIDNHQVTRSFGKDARGTLQPMILSSASSDEARAVADGEVRFAGSMRQLGRVVIVHHANNLQSVYALCRSLSVSAGESVSRGHTVCRTSSGDSGNELLFDMRRAGKPIDPRRVLR